MAVPFSFGLLKEYHEPVPKTPPRGCLPFFYGIVPFFSIVEREFTDNSLHYLGELTISLRVPVNLYIIILSLLLLVILLRRLGD